MLRGLACVTTAAVLPLPRMAFALPEQQGYDSVLRPLPLAAVRLSTSEIRDAAEINQNYLESLSTDRLLHMFRITAGITSNAQRLGGWEEPTCELRGHFAGGHFLSAAALAYATSGNGTLRDRGNAMVSALAACQKANGNGYLSAYPESFFERLARGKPVWAPFYTLHKILAGLLDMYVHTGNEEALQVAENISGWVQSYFGGIGDDQRQRMLRTEYGGMNEALVNLYALTKRERHLAAARLFEQPSFLDPLALRRDELQGLHANTNVPKVIGAARSYEVTGDPRYRAIANYFLEEVLAARSYAIGNTSEDEHWKSPAGDLAGSLSLTNAECCVAYNLMKLERHVFGWSGDARCMDAYERSLFNCRLGTQNAQGLKQYFFPLAAGYWRVYNSPEDSFWCCTGTGAEEFAKFTDSIYFTGRGRLWVNQFIASTAVWKEGGLSLRQETAFPAEQATTLVITAAPAEKRTISLRIPQWIADTASVEVNGRPLEAFGEPGSYLALQRVWRAGDRVKLNLPMKLRTEPLLGTSETKAVLYGPLVLAADLGDGPSSGPTKILHGRGTTPKGIGAALPNPVVRTTGHASRPTPDWVDCVSAGDLSFRAPDVNGVRGVLPMYRIRDQRYAAYWDISTT